LPLDPLYLATAVEAALAAGRIQRAWFRSDLTVEKKGPIDLVTPADLDVERRFRLLIHERFPAHAVLGEEAGAEAPGAGSRFRWIVDPIDGTTNFAHGIALFCVSIALELDGRTVLGVVYDPMAEELYTAERDAGAWLNGVPLAVSSRGMLGDALLCTGFPYTVQQVRRRQVATFSAFLGSARAVRRLGSAALDLCYVAAGRLDGFWEEQLHPWDIAAGLLIVAEAGGAVTDYAGAPVDLFRGELVASNGRLHRPMLDVIARASGGQTDAAPLDP
jgi:myo-inositol-1(or 4)-monophosphatase